VLTTLAAACVASLRAAGIGLVTACFPRESAQARLLRTMGFRAWAGRLWGIELMVLTQPGQKGVSSRETSNARCRRKMFA